MNPKYRRTMYACFTGYIVQAIVNNFAPLLFLTFQDAYGLSIAQLTFLVTFNFFLQLAVDLASAVVIDKIGYRASAVAAHLLSAAGLVLLAVLPEVFPTAFAGLLTAVVVYALGGGLIEVLISPMVEACPSENKEAAMSLLHSFYCWGQVGVVLLSTLFFVTVGIEHWKILAFLWAVIPLVNALVFTRVPIARLLQDGETGMSVRELLTNKAFWMMALLMVCAGGSEMAVSQWASALAEKGLHIGKTLGDLTGTMLFAVMMGTSRVIYSKRGEKINLPKALLFSGILCIGSYLLIALSPLPWLGLAGCGLCGFSVGLLWPGTFSLASAKIARGGTALFALLALAGDLGCAAGPALVGWVSGMAEDNLRLGILAALALPVLLVAGILFGGKRAK